MTPSFVPQSEAANGQFSSYRRRFASTPFAGRIGANQKFSVDTDVDAEVLEKMPDAAPFVPWKQMLDVRLFMQVGLWKAAFIEGVGMRLLPWTPHIPCHAAAAYWKS